MFHPTDGTARIFQRDQFSHSLYDFSNHLKPRPGIEPTSESCASLGTLTEDALPTELPRHRQNSMMKSLNGYGRVLHLAVLDVGVIQVVAHLLDLLLELGLALLQLDELGVEVLDGALALGQPGLQLQLRVLQLLNLGHSVPLVLEAVGHKM